MEEELRKYLKEDDTLERCGLILKNGTILEVDNVHPQPDKGFEIDCAALVEHEPELEGTWHTHPGHGSNLSQSDWFGFIQWPKLKHWIIGANSVSCYVVRDGIVLNAD